MTKAKKFIMVKKGEKIRKRKKIEKLLDLKINKPLLRAIKKVYETFEKAEVKTGKLLIPFKPVKKKWQLMKIEIKDL